MPPVSVTILTKDSSKLLRRCLDAVKEFPDVVVLDNGSTDDTIGIAKEYANVRVFSSEFIGFGPLKDLAASHAVNDWVFSVDSDEVVSPELARAVLDHQLRDDQVGSVHRLNYFKGRVMNACGWQNDITKRLYNRAVTSYLDLRVHESLARTAGGEILLAGRLLHFTAETIDDLDEKVRRYATLYAEQNRQRKRSSTAKAIVLGASRFVRDYILLKGFLYGSDGFNISRLQASGVYDKYKKLAELNKAAGP